MTFVSVDFTDYEMAWLSSYMDDGESVEHAVHGIVMMVLADLDAQAEMGKEVADD